MLHVKSGYLTIVEKPRKFTAANFDGVSTNPPKIERCPECPTCLCLVLSSSHEDVRDIANKGEIKLDLINLNPYSIYGMNQIR